MAVFALLPPYLGLLLSLILEPDNVFSLVILFTSRDIHSLTWPPYRFLSLNMSSFMNTSFLKNIFSLSHMFPLPFLSQIKHLMSLFHFQISVLQPIFILHLRHMKIPPILIPSLPPPHPSVAHPMSKALLVTCKITTANPFLHTPHQIPILPQILCTLWHH